MRVRANVTCVAIGGRAILIEGPPGSGKSSLALALIDRGAVLVGDDGVILERRHGELWAHPPPEIAGKLEIRGVGIIDMATIAAPVALVLSLQRDPPRLPDAETIEVEGIALPRLSFDAYNSAAPLRAEWALRVHGQSNHAPAD